MLFSLMFFVLFYLGLTNWVRIMGTVGKSARSFFHKVKFKKLNDPQFIKKYKDKTGIEFIVKVVESDGIHAAMAGVPFWPVMILSSRALNELNENELDWIICHEAGHCVKWHIILTALFQLSLLVFGIFIINNFNLGVIASIAIASLFGLIFYQLERYFSEYQADLYALNKVDSLEGMISANEKMKKHWTKNAVYKNKILMFLITPHLHYDTRIKMARKKLKSSFPAKVIY